MTPPPALTAQWPLPSQVKFAWKAQRDIAERGATMEEVRGSTRGNLRSEVGMGAPERVPASTARHPPQHSPISASAHLHVQESDDFNEQIENY